jgi:hypothetical protein
MSLWFTTTRDSNDSAAFRTCRSAAALPQSDPDRAAALCESDDGRAGRGCRAVQTPHVCIAARGQLQERLQLCHYSQLHRGIVKARQGLKATLRRKASASTCIGSVIGPVPACAMTFMCRWNWLGSVVLTASSANLCKHSAIHRADFVPHRSVVRASMR